MNFQERTMRMLQQWYIIPIPSTQWSWLLGLSERSTDTEIVRLYLDATGNLDANL